LGPAQKQKAKNDYLTQSSQWRREMASIFKINPGRTWMPDRVGHDKLINTNVAMDHR
jgi:hypothetical protein